MALSGKLASVGSAMSKRSNLILASMVAAIAIIDCAYVYHKGVTLGGDSTKYSRWGDLLISKGFDIQAYLSDTSFLVPPVLYVGWVVVVALCKAAFGASWATGLVVINLLLTIATSFMVFSLVFRVTRSLAPPMTAFALFAGCYDIHVWVPLVLSDASYMALSTVILYLLLSGQGREKHRMGIYLAQALLLMFALIYRPSAAPLAMAVIVGYCIKFIVGDGSALKRAMFARKLFLALIALFAFTSAAHALVMQDTSLWVFSFAREWVVQISREYHDGFVVYQRPETYNMPPSAYMDYIIITMKKFAYFFAIDASGFSISHTIVNYAFFIPAYCLSIVAIASLLRADSSLSGDSWMVALVSLITIMFYSLFHTLQEVDFDWRYRLPCIPPLILLAAMGMAETEARWSQWRKPVSVTAE